MNMRVNEQKTVNDIAFGTQGERGTFLAQRITSAGKPETLIVVAAEGHSIKSLRAPGSQTPWTLTKLSNSDISEEYEDQFSGSRSESRERQRQ